MANQSLIAVPPDLADPVVVRRVISRIVEELDVLRGSRASEETDSSIQGLLTRLEELQERLTQAELQLNELIDERNQIISEAIGDLADIVQELQTQVVALSNYAAIKAISLRFTVDASDVVQHVVDYNIDTVFSSRIGVGQYRFRVDQTQFFGEDVLTNSTVSTEHLISPSPTSELFDVSLVSTGTPGTFIIEVKEFVVGSGNKLVIQAYDLQPGDLVDVTALFTHPNSTLPPETNEAGAYS